MRIFEFELPPTYLLSRHELTIGSIIEEPHACDLGAAREEALERRRPASALPRDASLSLLPTPSQSCDHVYLVQPIGQVDRYHRSWLTKLVEVDPHKEGEADHYATGFWSGRPIPEDRDASWEYRTMKAKVLKRVGGCACALSIGAPSPLRP